MGQYIAWGVLGFIGLCIMAVVFYGLMSAEEDMHLTESSKSSEKALVAVAASFGPALFLGVVFGGIKLLIG